MIKIWRNMQKFTHLNKKLIPIDDGGEIPSVHRIDTNAEEMNILFPPDWLNKPCPIEKAIKELEEYEKNH